MIVIGLQVIGAGLMRTGTTSLKLALETLYGRPCYHMYNIVRGNRKADLKKWIKLLRKYRSGSIENEGMAGTLRSIHVGHAAAVDYPTCIFYKELMELYPKAKIILTFRDGRNWLASCRATTLSQQLLAKPSMGGTLAYILRGVAGLPELHDLMFSATLGDHYDRMTDDQLVSAYERWNADVIATVPQERLVLLKTGSSWNELCPALGLPVDVVLNEPFPNVNKREDMMAALESDWKLGRRMDHLIFTTICILMCISVLVSANAFYGGLLFLRFT